MVFKRDGKKAGLPGQDSKGGAGGEEVREAMGMQAGQSRGGRVGCAGHVGSWDTTHSGFSYQWSQLWLVPDVGSSGAPSRSCSPARAPPPAPAPMHLLTLIGTAR